VSVRTRPLLNRVLTTKLRLPVIEIEVVALRAGNEFDLEFVRDTGEWRRGVYLMTEGQLEIDSVGGSQLEVWRDTAPSVVPVTCRRTTSGYLEMFNIWNRGRGLELRRLHSGMIRTQVAERTFEYRCLDSDPDPSVEDFERFVIRLTFKLGMSLPEPLSDSDRNEAKLTTASGPKPRPEESSRGL